MIRILKIESYTGFILDNPVWVFVPGMIIIKFNFIPCSKDRTLFPEEELGKISVRVYKKHITAFDMFKYEMGDLLRLTGLICIDENEDERYKIDDSDIFLMII